MSAPDPLTPMIQAIQDLRDRGYLFPGDPQDLATTALRRWQSYDRRHPKHKHITRQDRIRDLTKGLQARFEPTGLYCHVREWEGLAEKLAEILAA